MDHTFQVSEEQYAKLTAYAVEQKETPEMLFQAWVNEVIRQEAQRSRLREQANQQEQEEHEEGPLDLLKIAGMFSIGEPGWADQHDEIFGGDLP
jgi:hypothetical protein